MIALVALDVVMLMFLAFLVGVFVGAMGFAFSHDVRMEKRRRASIAAYDSTQRKAAAKVMLF